MVKQRYYGSVVSLLGVWAGSPSRMSVQHQDQSQFRSCVSESRGGRPELPVPV